MIRKVAMEFLTRWKDEYNDVNTVKQWKQVRNETSNWRNVVNVVNNIQWELNTNNVFKINIETN